MSFDIDGLLCVDPTVKETEYPEKYLKHLKYAEPIITPSEVGIVVTGRLEKFRPETEAWLAHNKIKYKKLFMNPAETPDERKKRYPIAKTKIKQLLDTSVHCHVESSLKQSIEISSYFDVICWADKRIYRRGQCEKI